MSDETWLPFPIQREPSIRRIALISYRVRVVRRLIPRCFDPFFAFQTKAWPHFLFLFASELPNRL